jgi:hypothetical protein
MRANISVEMMFPSELLADWNWLLKRPYALIAMNNFGDMFLRDSNGEIQLLVLTSGSLTKIADSQAEFQNLVADKEYQASVVLTGPADRNRASRNVVGAGSVFLV